jgi:hypothetical protein
MTFAAVVVLINLDVSSTRGRATAEKRAPGLSRGESACEVVVIVSQVGEECPATAVVEGLSLTAYTLGSHGQPAYPVLTEKN